jgi:acyl-CoA thioester hydrolase
VRVRYADTDAMGVAYHGNFLAFFETGRVEAMRQIGSHYVEIVRRGVHLVVIEATVHYRQPAKFDDVLLIQTSVAEIGKARFSFVYEIRREVDEALVASGHTVHACVDAQSLRPLRVPAWLVEDLLRLKT